ncbi:DUF4856 domain-containing protein [Tenacibaculum jejuense]|uniref:Probable lipoprotein n=1 Tax=Tenacibaculum jejuense TaxID=584609 RepID=A0A238UA83_9FLAO|nr:DUF4856 domain-containing protein [Tenacibaculum jejuense]SNR16012.1 Probable lipoprotein precursor [Tenacibaculum jejuense]
MKKGYLSVLAIAGLFFVSCSDDDNNIPDNPNVEVEAPDTYKFERNGSTSVSYSGQTTRIKMAEELISSLKDDPSSTAIPTTTEAQLDGMFAHVEGNADFSDADLNASDKSIRSKTAASRDYFFSNVVEGTVIKEKFDNWIAEQVDVVFPNWNTDAAPGVAGRIQEAGGGSNRLVNGKGLELDQAVNKTLIGALMVDQMLNNYLGVLVLDEGTNVADNDNQVLATDKNYTNMEHKWDEAFGYLYGTDDAENPQYNADSFLSKYVFRVEGDSDFVGISKKIYDAFKKGRQAIVVKNYAEREAQAKIIRDEVSKIIAIRAVYYLQQAKLTLATDKGAAFHDLSEGYGFIESLRFTRNTADNAPYFTATEISGFTNDLLEGNGFWDVTPATLDEISKDIADKFDFTVEKAGS